MVLVLQPDDVYWESILGVAGKKVLTGERLANVSPTLVSTFRQTVPKPLTPRPASWERTDAILRRVDQLALLK